MEKIPTVFERDWDGDRSRVLPQIHAGCEWVIDGEGVATRKVDGTCVMFDGTLWWARRDVHEGKEPPPNYVALTDPDPETGKISGWEPIEQSPFAKFWEEALRNANINEIWPPGTYELLGPKIQKNPERLERHELWGHALSEQALVNRTFDGMKAFLEKRGWEGVVFHHPDGRMAKIKGRDFGLRRG